MWEWMTGVFNIATIEFLQGGDVEQQVFNYFFTLVFICAIFPLPFTWLGSIIRHSWRDK